MHPAALIQGHEETWSWLVLGRRDASEWPSTSDAA
jgi:hypothetical protein